MYRNARHLFIALIATVAAFLPSALLNAKEVTVLSASWEGNDYVVRFSDSLSYTVDLAASDSMLVLHFSRPVALMEGEAKGPNGVSAAFSRNPGDSMVVLTVRGRNRIEYSTLWRPYSHRLIVHTFDSDSLVSNYAAQQYHLGLLALEQNLPDQARGYLSSALAFDNGEIARRASSVLGVMYAREGKDSLALLYLNAPFDADDYMARAEVNRRSGQVDAAARDEEMFGEKMADLDDVARAPYEDAGPPEERNADEGRRPPIARIFDDWRGIVLVAIAAILIIWLAVWFSRRPVPPQGSQDHEPHRRDHPPAPPREEAPRTGTTGPPPTTASTIAAPPAPVRPAPPAPTTVSKEHEERSSAAPDPIISSLHAPEIIPSPQRDEKKETAPPSGTIQLPQPDALPDQASETEVKKMDREAERASEPEPAARVSTQAEQLRRRMEAATSVASMGSTTAQGAHTGQAEHESTVTEARRLNVSRDYVELRNRIAELRRRIEES